MTEVGLVHFARVARQVAEAALPPYRSRFSKHTFPQPTLLAILCLMRYEDWTYRETEVRLREHSELRTALGIDRVPDYTTLYRCLRRLREEDLTRLLDEAIRRMPPPLLRGRRSPLMPPAWLRGRSVRSLSTACAIAGRGSPGATGSTG